MHRNVKKLLPVAAGVLGLACLGLTALPASGADQPTTYSDKTLHSFTAKLDKAARPAASDVASWGPRGGKIVVRALPGGQQAAERFIARAGLDRAAVKIETTKLRPKPLADIRGGDAYYINNSARCSVGFSVEGGFVTAGHCGSQGDPTTGHDQTDQGTFEASVFPGDADMGWVSTNDSWTPTPKVAGESGDIEVIGSEEAEVGAEVCRSGSTTGWHCGEILAKDQTVNYPQGTVSGLTHTTVCAEPGDSGGPYVAGQQAQGVTSGGSGNCSSGGETFFQPVNEILDTYSLTLVTAGG